MEKLLISNSPHIRSNASTKRIMIDVLIALLPATIFGIVSFGYKALLIVLVSVLSAIIAEFLYKLILKKPFKQCLKEFDYTSAVTGLILGLNLNTSIGWHLYIPALGAFFAIIVVKMIFGGTGKNFVNPAVAGRVFLMLSFATMVAPAVWQASNLAPIGKEHLLSGATILGDVLSGTNTKLSVLDMFIGTGVAGCIGETSKACLLLGAIYLLIRKVIDFKPFIYILVVGLWTVICRGWDFTYFLPSILSGGLFLGALFMATDYVTCPNTKLGTYIYYVLLGVLTAWLRMRSGAEVVSLVILLCNLAVPLIDRFVIPKPFGYEKPKKTKKEGK